MAQAARRIVTAAFAAVMVSVGTAARADQAPGAVELAWVRAEGAESCPAGPVIERDVAERLGHNPFVSGALQRIEGMVLRREPLWVARFYVRDRTGALVGSREISSEATGCEPVSNAIALALALAIDPEAALRPAPPPPVPNATNATGPSTATQAQAAGPLPQTPLRPSR